MFNLPSIPDIDAIHPLVIHFPVALLLVAPVFIILGIVNRSRSRCFFVCGFILMFLGTIGSFVAIASGEAAAELVERTPEIKAVLEKHQNLAESTRTFFVVMVIINAIILLLPKFFKERMQHFWIRMMNFVYLVAYAIGCIMLTNTAHQGGNLVHGLGVRAMINFDQPNSKPVPQPKMQTDSTANRILGKDSLNKKSSQ